VSVDRSRDWLPQYLKDIVPALLAHMHHPLALGDNAAGASGIGAPGDPATVETARAAARRTVLAVGEKGLRHLNSCLTEAYGSDEAVVRAEALKMAAVFCRETPTEFAEMLPLMMREVLKLFADQDAAVLKAALDAMKAFEERFGKEELAEHVDFIRQTINNLVSKLKHQRGGCALPVGSDGQPLLPGLCQKKGLAPFLGMLQHALHRGPQRQEAALMYADLVRLTDQASLRPFLIKITGPLIRGVGDRFQSKVKVGILRALSLVLDKGGTKLKPFLPQLHTTFVKNLHDDSAAVRTDAAAALGKLVGITTRVDPLVKDLCSNVANTAGGGEEVEEVRATILAALSDVLLQVGHKVKPKSLQLAWDTLSDARGEADQSSRVSVAEGLALCARNSSDEQFLERVQDLVHEGAGIRDMPQWRLRHGVALEVAAVAQHCSGRLQAAATAQIAKVAVGALKDDNVMVQTAAATALMHLVEDDSAGISPALAGTILDAVSPLVVPTSNKDLLRTACHAVRLSALSSPQAAVKRLAVLVPSLYTISAKHTANDVRVAAQQALASALQIHSEPSVLAAYLDSVKPAFKNELSRFVTQTLSTLPL